MSGPRIGRPDLLADLARGVTRPVDPLSPPGPDPVRLALQPRLSSPDICTAASPRERREALLTAAQQLAAELAPVPRALNTIATRVRARIRPAQRPGDDALLDDLQDLHERAFALWLDVGRLAEAAGRER